MIEDERESSFPMMSDDTQYTTDVGQDNQITSVDKKEKTKSRDFKYRFARPDETEKTDLNLTVIGKGFCNRTSSHGITQVYTAPKGSKKIIWIVLTILMIIMLIIHTTILVVQYTSFGTTTDLSIVPTRKLDFPAVTICNSNVIKKEPVSDFSTPPPTNPWLGHKVDLFDGKADYLAMNDPSKGHQLKDLIVKASFDHVDVNIEESFELLIDGRYGNCYTFNKNNSATARRSSPAYGLELLLNIEYYAYDDSLYVPVSWAGAIINVHHPDIEPIPEQGGLAVGPGTLNRLPLVKSDLMKLGGRYGDCLEADEEKPKTYYTGYYTKDGCDNTCLQRETISKCCCYIQVMKYNLSEFEESWTKPTDEQLAELVDWDVCHRDEMQACVSNQTCWVEVWNRYNDGQLACSECRDLCRDVQFQISASPVSWPTEAYKQVLVTELNETHPNLIADIGLYVQADSLTNELIAKNFLQVQIYYGTMATTFIKENPEVRDFEFIAELGGTFGLWIGWTMMTFFEFFEFLADVVTLQIMSKTGRLNHRENSS